MSPQVRTTAPEKYRVKPSSNCCEPGASVDIVVSLHGGTALYLCTLLHSQQMFPNAEPQNNQMVQSITFPKCRQPLFFTWHTYFKSDKRIISPKQTIRQLTVLRELKHFVAFKHWSVSCRLWWAAYNSGISATYFRVAFFSPSFYAVVLLGFFFQYCHVSHCFFFLTSSVSEPSQPATLVLLLI